MATQSTVRDERAKSHRLIVRLDDTSSLRAFIDRLTVYHAGVETVITEEPMRLIVRTYPGSQRSASEVAAVLESSAGVRYAVPESFWPMELRRHEPNDPLFPTQWHLDNTAQGGRVVDADVDAPEAWSYSRGSADVVIAVLDDGVQLDHPDLAANVSRDGRDFTVDPPGPSAAAKAITDRHGTSVAGIVAARGDNELGVTGICPRCTILPIRVYGSSNLGTAAAFRYAVEHGADIITNSWGYTRDVPKSIRAGADDAVRDAIEEAGEIGRDGRGTLIVFGVTNDVVDNCSGPRIDISSLESVVAVGVSDHNDHVGGSGFGACLDLVAPAKPERRSTIGVMTTDRTGIDGHTAGDYHSTFGGTSAAAPLVAGIAGLLLSLNPELTRTELQRILEHTAEKIDPEHARYDARGFSERAGHGRVNAARALVPTVKISITPERVAVGEEFSVTVTASAPFGLDSVSWTGVATGVSGLDRERARAVDGDAVASVTWHGLAIDRPGRFTFGASAIDRRRSDPLPGYPHRADAAHAEIEVLEQPDAFPR